MRLILALTSLLLLAAVPAQAADTLNAYSIWPENWAKPMFEEFEKATGIHVNFVRFSSGEALARVIAEKNNPRVDVRFGGPVETHAAGIKEGVFWRFPFRKAPESLVRNHGESRSLLFSEGVHRASQRKNGEAGLKAGSQA